MQAANDYVDSLLKANPGYKVVIAGLAPSSKVEFAVVLQGSGISQGRDDYKIFVGSGPSDMQPVVLTGYGGDRTNGPSFRFSRKIPGKKGKLEDVSFEITQTATPGDLPAIFGMNENGVVTHYIFSLTDKAMLAKELIAFTFSVFFSIAALAQVQNPLPADTSGILRDTLFWPGLLPEDSTAMDTVGFANFLGVPIPESFSLRSLAQDADTTGILINPFEDGLSEEERSYMYVPLEPDFLNGMGVKATTEQDAENLAARHLGYRVFLAGSMGAEWVVILENLSIPIAETEAEGERPHYIIYKGGPTKELGWTWISGIYLTTAFHSGIQDPARAIEESYVDGSKRVIFSELQWRSLFEGVKTGAVLSFGSNWDIEVRIFNNAMMTPVVVWMLSLVMIVASAMGFTEEQKSKIRTQVVTQSSVSRDTLPPWNQRRIEIDTFMLRYMREDTSKWGRELRKRPYGIIPIIITEPIEILPGGLMYQPRSFFQSFFEKESFFGVPGLQPVPKDSTETPPQDSIISEPIVAVDNVGGINLNAKLLDLQIKRDEKGIPLPFEQQDLEKLKDVKGFLPIIINIQPIQNLPKLLGLDQTPADENTPEIAAQLSLKAVRMEVFAV